MLNCELSMSWCHPMMKQSPYHVQYVRRLLSQNFLRMTNIGSGRTPQGRMIEYVFVVLINFRDYSFFKEKILDRYTMRHAAQRPSLQQISYYLHVCGMDLHREVLVELLKYIDLDQHRPSMALDHRMSRLHRSQSPVAQNIRLKS
jgi:hypothetical protein